MDANRKSNNRLLRVIGALAAVTILSLGILAGSLAGRPAAAAAPENNAGKGIRVTGNGEARVQPDLAHLNFQILANGATADESLAAYEKSAAALTARLQALGLAEKDIVLEPITTTPTGREGAGIADGSNGYTTHGLIRATVRDLDKLRDVAVEGLKAEKGIGIGYIQYALQDDAQARAEAMNKAIDNARGQADAVAAKLGLTVKEVVAVSVHPNHAGPIERGEAGKELTVFGARPDIIVNLSVDVSYNFE